MKVKPIKTEDLVFFCGEMSLLLRSGIPYLEGLSILEEDMEPCPLKSHISALKAEVNTGSLGASMERVGGFPSYFIAMVKVGEQTGSLDRVMEELSLYYRRNEAVEQSVRSAVIYPLIMALMMFAVVLVLVVKVLPLFYQVLQDFSGALSSLALGLMNFGILLSKNAAAVTVILLILLFVLLYFALVPRGKAQGKRCLTKIFRGTAHSLALAKFSAAMTLMLKSGMDFNASLDMAKTVVAEKEFVDKIEGTRVDLAEGMSFAAAVTKSGLFPRVHSAMLSLAMQTGQTDEAMNQLAELYHEEAENRISGVVAVVEPVLVGVFSLIVACVLLSVILPLMGVMDAL